MSNFIFISPNFPTNYWQFCRELKNDGMNVLGIGDQPYDELRPELKDSLNEYYKVGSLENYDEVYRAVAFFAFKYGRIDWLESNNEYWLERDAALRTDFNIKRLPDLRYAPHQVQEQDEGVLPEGRHRHRTLPHGGRPGGLQEVHRRGGLSGGGQAGQRCGCLRYP